MKHRIEVLIPKIKSIDLELDDSLSPKTCKELVKTLPFKVGLNIWGEEIYSDSTPINVDLENAKPLVELNDVAYWPTGKAICLFFGPTPIGGKNEIKPYSPVNIIGKILKPDKSIINEIHDGIIATFQLRTN